MSIRKLVNPTNVVLETPQDVSYIGVGGGAAITVHMTMEESPIANFQFTFDETISFVDTNPDTIVRTRGSWIDDGFRSGMTATFTGTTSNNASYVITGVTDKILTTSDSVVAEVDVDGSGVTVVGNIPEASWILYETIGAAASKFTYIEGSGTAIRVNSSGGTIWVQS